MEHEINPVISIISIIIYIAAVFVSFATLSRARKLNISARSWVLGGGSTTGIGIWVAHFLGMLSYSSTDNVDYNLLLSMLSLCISLFLFIGFAYFVAIRNVIHLQGVIILSLILSSFITLNHLIGIQSLNLSPIINYTLYSFGFILLFFSGYIFVKQSLFALKSERIFSNRNIISAIVVGLMLSFSNFIFKSSISFIPITHELQQSYGVSIIGIAVLIISSVFALLLINAAILTFDIRKFEAKWDVSRKELESSQKTLDIAKKVTEQLAIQFKESEEFNKKLFDTVANIVFVVDKYGYIVRMNQAAEKVTRYLESELTGKEFSKVLLPDEEYKIFVSLFEKLLTGDKTSHHIGSILTSKGSVRTIEWFYTELLDENSDVEFVIASGTDITEQRFYEETMRLAAVSFETSEAIFITDSEGNILRVNRAFTEITGYSEKESYGNNPSFLKSGKHSTEFYQEMWKQLNEKGVWIGEIWNKRKNGEIYPEWLHITSVYDDLGKLTNYVASFSDLSDMKHAEEQIHFYSNFDAATKLPNSKLFIEILDKELDVAKMEGNTGALLFVELIHLDKLTDNIGIGSVDSYINQLLNTFHQKFGKEIIVGRISNTDLAILLNDISKHQVISQSVEVAEFILNIVKGGLFINDKVAYINANIGIVDYSDKDNFADELLQHANTAANRARKIEHDSYQFYSEYMQKVASENYQFEVALRAAVEKSEFELLLQPQVNIDNELIGAEALIRWNRGSGIVSPDKFIPIAEESNLIIDIGDWVLRKAIDYIKIIEKSEIPNSFKNISVNVSAIQFQQENFLTKLKKLVIQEDIVPSHLKLEITETAVLQKPHVVINKIAALKEIGISVALDDFGTGYSSLSYLQKMQIDQLKIDRSFVIDLAINKTSQALTETIIVMAKNLGMEVIAEGVENQKEKSILASYGCTQYQGYYFSRPIDFDAFLDYAKHPIQV